MEGRLTPGLLQGLNSMMNIYSRLLNRILRTYPVPLSMPEYIVLWSIYDYPDQTQYKIAQITGYTVQRCHQIVASLEESELLTKSHEPFGNKTRLSLSDRGLEVIEDLMNRVQMIMKEGLSETELSVIEESSFQLIELSNLIKKSSAIRKFIR